MGPTERLTDRIEGVDEPVPVPDVAEWTANQIQTA